MCSIPVVCPVSCRLHVEGSFTGAVHVLSTHVDDIHAVLELARTDAAAFHLSSSAQLGVSATGEPGRHTETSEGYGPRVLVVGETNTGKSSLCRTLTNLATTTQKCSVALVDVDVGQQGITCPGSIAAVFVENYIPVDDGFNTMMPLVFFFGGKAVTASSRRHYLDLCACAAAGVTSVAASKPAFAIGGTVVNTMGWTNGIGRDILYELLSLFSITHVVICGSDDELAEDLRKAAIGRNIIFLSYPKQTRMPPRTAAVRSAWRDEQVVSYLQGTLRTPLTSYRGIAFVKDVYFLDALTLKPMPCQDVRPLTLAAVSWADSVEFVDQVNVAGFIVILEVGKRFFSFLSPASGSLPKPFILVSDNIQLPWEKVPPFSAP
ncbi:unnamed protein product [Trypanosoma congolense IL3000]|uniref:WGS project CAEQ00000000 data, annotated contig 1298 n=1 Tax=Trypanosoma congolense (strain IL3000) TaxID=1068625 RepID=F9W5A1_TRYCI|nr:unnamed protein product [Trypanosoma congolense IL3000]